MIGNGPKPEHVAAAARPRQQHVEGVGEDELRRRAARRSRRPAASTSPSTRRPRGDTSPGRSAAGAAAPGRSIDLGAPPDRRIQHRLPDDQRPDCRPERTCGRTVLCLHAGREGDQEQSDRQGRRNPRNVPDGARRGRRRVSRASRRPRRALRRSFGDGVTVDMSTGKAYLCAPAGIEHSPGGRHGAHESLPSSARRYRLPRAPH